MKKMKEKQLVSINELFDKYMKSALYENSGEIFKASSLINTIDKVIAKSIANPEKYSVVSDISEEWKLDQFFNMAITKNKLNAAKYFITNTEMLKNDYNSPEDLKRLVSFVSKNLKAEDSKKIIFSKVIKVLDIEEAVLPFILSDKTSKKKNNDCQKIVNALNTYFDNQITENQEKEI